MSKRKGQGGPGTGDKKISKPAWLDSDEEIKDEDGLQYRRVKTEPKPDQLYKTRLVDQFTLVHGPKPDWAQPDKKKKKVHEEKNESADEDEGTNNDANYASSLPRGKLQIHKVFDLNGSGRKEGPIIRSISFHPNEQVAIVSGGDTASIYQVDGCNNNHIKEIKFENFPIRNTSFSSMGDELFVSSGQLGYFYSYDMISGKMLKFRPNQNTQNETIRNLVVSPDKKCLAALGHNGNIFLYSVKSKEVIHTFTMNGEVSSVAFNDSGSKMYSFGNLGEVFIWDIASRSCVNKFIDEGCVQGTKVAYSNPYSFFACGSTSGVVNLYDTNEIDVTPKSFRAQRKPLKVLMNLVTSITDLNFNSTGEILAMASVEKENAIRLVHLPSMNVFTNFPFLNANWGRINAMAFSPNGGFFSIGSNKGSAYLFKLGHYSNY